VDRVDGITDSDVRLALIGPLDPLVAEQKVCGAKTMPMCVAR
jgi:hypothetical protein